MNARATGIGDLSDRHSSLALIHGNDERKPIGLLGLDEPSSSAATPGRAFFRRPPAGSSPLPLRRASPSTRAWPFRSCRRRLSGLGRRLIWCGSILVAAITAACTDRPAAACMDRPAAFARRSVVCARLVIGPAIPAGHPGLAITARSSSARASDPPTCGGSPWAPSRPVCDRRDQRGGRCLLGRPAARPELLLVLYRCIAPQRLLGSLLALGRSADFSL